MEFARSSDVTVVARVHSSVSSSKYLVPELVLRLRPCHRSTHGEILAAAAVVVVVSLFADKEGSLVDAAASRL